MVTGTSRGVGRGLAEHYANRGMTVVGCSRGEATFEHPNYHHAQVDVTDEKAVREWVRGAKKAHGALDAVIANVGMVRSALLMPVTAPALVREFVDSIVMATYNVCYEVAKVMIPQRRGRIVTLASTMTALHEPGTVAYSGAKSAVISMTKVMARELVSFGITCNVLSPSLVVTDASSRLGDEWKARMLDLQTIKRTVEIDELCNVVDFFLDDRSACITGQVVHTCLVD